MVVVWHEQRTDISQGFKLLLKDGESLLVHICVPIQKSVSMNSLLVCISAVKLIVVLAETDRYFIVYFLF